MSVALRGPGFMAMRGTRATSTMIALARQAMAQKEFLRNAKPAKELTHGSYECIYVRLRENGKRERKRLKKAGERAGDLRIPGILQARGHFEDVLLDVPQGPLQQAWNKGLLSFQKHGKVKFCGPLYTLRLEHGADSSSSIPFTEVRAKPTNILIHPLSEKVLNVSFVLAPEAEPVRVRVPIRIMNMEKCTALRSGGYINRIFRDVDIAVAPGAISPLVVTADIAGMKLKDKLYVKDLVFDGKGEGCRTVLPDDNLAVVISSV